MTMSDRPNTIEVGRLDQFVASDPVVRKVVDAAGEMPVYLVGGSVRDLLVGRKPTELDFVIEGDVERIAHDLDPDARVHDDFGTALASVDGVSVDLVRARSEHYPEPGSLPVVEPADLATDLARRDFTINSMAIQVGRPGDLIDPFDGLTDLGEGVIRTLHENSFIDDPTRAFRAARYCSRLGLIPDPSTLGAMGQVDLTTVSGDRIDHELDLIALEDDPASAIELLHAWRVLEVEAEALRLAPEAFGLLESGPWHGACSRQELLRGLLSSPHLETARSLTEEPSDRWEAYRLVRNVEPAAAVIARAAGANWVDAWPKEWKGLELGISGNDLIAAGVPEGPAVGAGMEAALRDRLLNGEQGTEREMTVALEEARRRVDA